MKVESLSFQKTQCHILSLLLSEDHPGKSSTYLKYLVKIFLGPIAIATYTIPQQLTGKLSIFSKGFSAFLLPTLSRRGGDTNSFNYTLEIFLKIIPILIFFIFPLYEIFLNFWLKNNYKVGPKHPYFIRIFMYLQTSFPLISEF